MANSSTYVPAWATDRQTAVWMRLRLRTMPKAPARTSHPATPKASTCMSSLRLVRAGGDRLGEELGEQHDRAGTDREAGHDVQHRHRPGRQQLLELAQRQEVGEHAGA